MTSQAHFKTPCTRSHSAGRNGTLYVEPTPRLYRLYSSAEASSNPSSPPLFQSKAAYLVWEGTSYGLNLAFHIKDVTFASNTNAGLKPSNHKGPSSLPTQYYDLVASDRRTIETAVAWTYTAETPIEGPLKSQLLSTDLICIDTDRFPSALEEDEPILGHVKNPYHRVDAVRTSRHVQIYAKTQSGEEVLVADTAKGDSTRSQAMAIFETALPTRWYLPADCLLVNDTGPSKMKPPPACRVEDYPKDGFTTVCPYKGIAKYHKLILPDGSTLDNAIWAYPEAIPALDLRGLTCFWVPGNDRLKLIVDGEHIAN